MGRKGKRLRPIYFEAGVTMAKEETNKIVSKKHLARLERENIQRKWIIRTSIIVVVLVVGIIGYGILDMTVLRGMQPIAKVDGDPIPTNEYVAFVKYYRWQMIQQYQQTYQMAQLFGGDSTYASYFQNQLTQIQSQLDDPTTIGEQVKDLLIDDRLIRHEADRLGITVTKEEVDKALEEAFGFYPNGTPTPAVFPTALPTGTISPEILKEIATLTPTAGIAPTEAAQPTETVEATQEPTTPTQVAAGDATPEPTAAPTATATPYTREGFQDLYTQYLTSWKEEAGLTEADIRLVYERSLYRDKVLEQITKDVKPVEDQVWARHILVETIDQAREVLGKLKNGENFAALAAEYSLDTSNKDSGGDLGWFGRGQMVSDFENAAFSLKVGEISEPVSTTFGFHIIQVLGHEEKSVDETTFDSLKQTAFNKWLEEEKTNSKVEEFDYWRDRTPSTPDLSIISS